MACRIAAALESASEFDAQFETQGNRNVWYCRLGLDVIVHLPRPSQLRAAQHTRRMTAIVTTIVTMLFFVCIGIGC